MATHSNHATTEQRQQWGRAGYAALVARYGEEEWQRIRADGQRKGRETQRRSRDYQALGRRAGRVSAQRRRERRRQHPHLEHP